VSWKKKLEAAIKRNGLRMTRQRMAIAAAFFEADGHLNAEEICALVRSEHPGIGQATVYRTMRMLEGVGLVTSSNFGASSARFEAADEDHHDHLICTECGHIVEFMNEDIERLQDEIAERYGMVLTSHRMELYGRCDDPKACTRR
jgi:Fur family ferric uptake transcriptional regulator